MSALPLLDFVRPAAGSYSKCGCGRWNNHASGQCADCRTVECVRCKKSHISRRIVTVRNPRFACGDCKTTVRNISRAYAAVDL
jgi:hypothetical protein